MLEGEPRDIRQIEGICERWGWSHERDAIGGATHPIEQEELPATWPDLEGLP